MTRPKKEHDPLDGGDLVCGPALNLPSVKIGQSFRVGASWYKLLKRNACSATVQAIGKTRVIRYEDGDGRPVEKEVAANLITRIATSSEIDEVKP